MQTQFYITCEGLEICLCFRYPKAVMELIEELSHGIVEPYREKQKSRIQRTFVSGSDAAGAKVTKGIRY